MEIVYFVLGVITVLSIGAIVIAINGKTKSDKTDKSVMDSIKDFKIEVEGLIKNTHRDIDEFRKDVSFNTQRIYGDIEKEKDRIYETIDYYKNEQDKEIEGIYRQMDSRFDKITNKIINK